MCFHPIHSLADKKERPISDESSGDTIDIPVIGKFISDKIKVWVKLSSLGIAEDAAPKIIQIVSESVTQIRSLPCCVDEDLSYEVSALKYFDEEGQFLTASTPVAKLKHRTLTVVFGFENVGLLSLQPVLRKAAVLFRSPTLQRRRPQGLIQLAVFAKWQRGEHQPRQSQAWLASR